MTWLLRVLEPGSDAQAPLLPRFKIDRGRSDCATPRRNKDIIEVLDAGRSLADWAEHAASYIDGLRGHYYNPQGSDDKLPPLTTDDVFLPILPLLQSDETSDPLVPSVPTVTAATADANGEAGGEQTRVQPKKAEQAKSCVLSSGAANVLLGEERRTFGLKLKEIGEVRCRLCVFLFSLDAGEHTALN